MPDDAAALLQSAISAAASSNGNLPGEFSIFSSLGTSTLHSIMSVAVSHSAPSGTLVAASTNALGVAQARASTSGSNSRQSSGTVVLTPINGSLSFVMVLFLVARMLVLYI